jgi:TolB-like protein/class 3 adenylate cyclase/Flp pilus assembly protein TadD
MERRLAAVMVADVVGYGLLSRADEEGTRERLRAELREVFEPQINSHQGRLVKTMGDGLLVEFHSAVDALRCAIEVQRAEAERNTGLLAERRLTFRIAINLGDVIVEGDDIHGDGVILADRLQSLAEPGGIAISGTTYDQVRAKLAVGYADLGERRVKNALEPVRVYRVLLDPTAAGRTISERQARASSWRRPVAIAAAALLVLAIAGGGALLLRPWEPRIEPASIERMDLPLPDKPSVAVLPFTNMSSDAGQEHFADGMTDDLITDLSKSSALFVIARNSTFFYKGKAVKISQVAEELGVRYVLEGSVQRAGDQVRVNAQLIDALTGGHIWADRFDGSISDIFAAQDEFVSKIVGALQVTLTKTEKEEIEHGKPSNIAAKEAFERGWNLYLRFSLKDSFEAVRHFEKAIELDPEYGRAYAALSLVYLRANYYGWNQDFGAADIARKGQVLEWERYLEQAQKYPTSLAYTAEALDLVLFGKASEARSAAGRSIALDPNDPEAHVAMAWALIVSGEPEEALNFLATAIRLNPKYPSHYVLARGVALFQHGDLKQAAEVFEEGFKRNPSAIAMLPAYASVLAHLGHRKEAREALLTLRPGSDQITLENLPFTLPIAVWEGKSERFGERLFDGFRIAGLPLDITVQKLIGELKRDDPFARQLAMKRLGWFGAAAAEAVPVLVKALEDDDLRQQAVEALGKIGPPAKAAVPALRALENEAVIGTYAKEALSDILEN